MSFAVDPAPVHTSCWYPIKFVSGLAVWSNRNVDRIDGWGWAEFVSLCIRFCARLVRLTQPQNPESLSEEECETCTSPFSGLNLSLCKSSRFLTVFMRCKVCSSDSCTGSSLDIPSCFHRMYWQCSILCERGVGTLYHVVLQPCHVSQLLKDPT